MTVHSPVGLNPEKYGVINTIPEEGTFANNDLDHSDPTGCDHSIFSEGLKKSLFNYMHGIGFELPLQKWFDFKIPRTIIPKNFIERCLELDEEREVKPSSKIVWLGNQPISRNYTKNKKGKQQAMISLQFYTKKENVEINIKENVGKWILEILELITIQSKKTITFEAFKNSYNEKNLGDFEIFWKSFTVAQLRDQGLLII